MSETVKKIVKAAITTDAMASGGIMTTAQANKFIRMVQDATALLSIVRFITMKAPKQEFDKIGVGKRIMRGAGETEDVSPYTQKPTFGRIELEAEKYALPYEISEESIEDNIEGKEFEQVVAELFSNQMGLDMEDVALNGDKVYSGTTPTSSVLNGAITDSSGIDIVLSTIAGFPRNCEAGFIKIDDELISYDSVNVGTNTLINCSRGLEGTTPTSHASGATVNWVRHALIGVDDGWIKQCYEDGANYVDLLATNSGNIEKSHFFKLFRAIPRKYTRSQNKSRLRWFMSSMQKSLWDEYLTSRNTGAGDSVIAGADFKPLGIPIVEVPSMPEDMIILTDPKNLIVGFWRRIKVRKTTEGKEAVMEDKRFYNSTVRWDYKIEETEAVSFGDGLKVA